MITSIIVMITSIIEEIMLIALAYLLFFF